VIHDAIHLSNYELMLEEHNAILEALLCGSIDQGLEYLEKHLINAKKRSVEYLKVFSIIPEPNIPPYLERIS
jgi:DNA-binding GntR family transcriptional regulator